MPIKRRIINLTVNGDALVAADARGVQTTDAGFQGEDGAVFLHLLVPDDWNDLAVRLQVAAQDGSCDLSGLADAGVIDMPLRSFVTVPGRLVVSLIGSAGDGVRRTAQCDSLIIAAVDCPTDPLPQLYPLAFENLCSDVAKKVVRTLTGSGGAKVTKTGDTAYNIDVSGTGGDMLMANYAAGTGKNNGNAVDHAAYADTTGTVKEAEHAAAADIAAVCLSAGAGSALESAINAKQPLLLAGGNGGVDILNSGTVRSLAGGDITLNADNNTVNLGLNGGLMKTGMLGFFAQSSLPDGWLPADGSALSKMRYIDLYGVIGEQYGKGEINGITVTPSYFYDDGSAVCNIVLQKYADGILKADAFKSSGMVFEDSFTLKDPGSYTVYCMDENGLEAVQYLLLPAYTAAYLLRIEADPLTRDQRRRSALHKTGGTSAISTVKLAAGIQSVSYFAGAGNTVGSADGAAVTFQDGTAYPAGRYTWYTKDAAGIEAVQYQNIVLKNALGINLSLDYYSDSFRVPDLQDSFKNLNPAIKD